MYRVLFFTLLLLLFLTSIIGYSQTFVIVDKDTYEVIEDVNYLLYNNKQVVYNGITSNDKPTTIENNIKFDSIVFF